MNKSPATTKTPRPRVATPHEVQHVPSQQRATVTTAGVAAAGSAPPDALDDAASLLASDHCIGSAHAKWLLLEYGDYECPSCREAEPLVRHLLDKFGSRMKFVFRHYPLEQHPHAELAAEAAEAAAAQDKFWPMHRWLLAHGHGLLPEDLARAAAQGGLNMHRYSAAMAEHAGRARVQEHRRSGQEIGLRGSPTFFLNGRLIDVSFGLEHLESAVRASLGDD